MSTLFQPVDAALVPRFAGAASFMRLPSITDPALVDVALVGVPFDGGTTNRPGPRHGPRQLRELLVAGLDVAGDPPERGLALVGGRAAQTIERLCRPGPQREPERDQHARPARLSPPKPHATW